jgi:predicted small integral membrane protein
MRHAAVGTGLPETFPPEAPVIATRYAKIVMVFGLALFGLIVGGDNIIDYGTNFAFVQHVLSMDTTFPGNALLWRSITSPVLHHVGYCCIIAAELATGLLFLVCAWKLAVNLKASAEVFHRAKSCGVLAATIGFATWFIGFMVMGGEWFASWQSKIWNGQQSAFYFYATILMVLIFLMQRDDELTV